MLTFSVFSDENFFGFFPLPFVDKLLISKHSSFEILVLEAIFAFVEMSHDQISIYSTALDFVTNLTMYPKIRLIKFESDLVVIKTGTKIESGQHGWSRT